MTAISHHNRKDLMIEARFLPDSIEQAEQLRHLIRSMIDSGKVDGLNPRNSEATANGITGWLIGKRDGVDGLTSNTRSQYRKVLHALEDQAPRDPQGGRVRRPGIVGVLGGSGAVMAGAIATGDPVAVAMAAVVVVAAPIIYEAPTGAVAA
jgi:hypothetical protein